MNKNIKIAKELVGIEKVLVSNAGDDIESMSKDEKINLAKNKNASPEILKKLAEDGEQLVKMGISKNPKAPVEALRKLAEDEDDWVRGLARHQLRKRGQ